jgi:hypothetical protein
MGAHLPKNVLWYAAEAQQALRALKDDVTAPAAVPASGAGELAWAAATRRQAWGAVVGVLGAGAERARQQQALGRACLSQSVDGTETDNPPVRAKRSAEPPPPLPPATSTTSLSTNFIF